MPRTNRFKRIVYNRTYNVTPYLDGVQCAGKYTVVSDYEKCSTQDLSVKSGETVQLIKEGEDGQW